MITQTKNKAKPKTIERVFDKNRPIIVIPNPDDGYGEEELSGYSGDFGVLYKPDKNTKYNCIAIEMTLSCREEFHEEMISRYIGANTDPNNFLFAHGGNFKSLSNFFTRLENKLNLPLNQRIKLKAIRPKFCLVQLSNWWKQNEARFQFLTIALRAGVKYTNNFENALFSQKYFSDTETAVNLFLDGYTILNKAYSGYEFDGWQSMFKNSYKEEKEIKLVLKKSRTKTLKFNS